MFCGLDSSTYVYTFACYAGGGWMITCDWVIARGVRLRINFTFEHFESEDCAPSPESKSTLD